MILLIILTLLLNFLSLVSSNAKTNTHFSVKKQISNIINTYKVNVLLMVGSVFYTIGGSILNTSNSINSAVHDINTVQFINCKQTIHTLPI